MTRQRNDQHSTEFGIWLRQQASLDSKLGFVATNIDYLWENYKTGDWMLIEEKRYGSSLTYSQQKQFKKIDAACHNANKYRGFHVVFFEKTSPDDGKIYIDGKEVTKEALIAFLQFAFVLRG